MAELTAGWPPRRWARKRPGSGVLSARVCESERVARVLGVRDAAILAATAIVVRAAWVLHTSNYQPVRDGVDYNRLGASLALGHGYVLNGKLTAFRPPGYAGFLGLWYAITGVPKSSWSGVRLAQAGLGTLSVVLIAVIAAQLWGRRSGLVAGAIACVYPPLWLVSESMVSEALFVPLMLLAVTCAVVVSRRRAGWPWVVACGTAIGLATLTRPVGLVMLAPLALLCAAGRPRWSRIAVLALTVAAVLAPWTIRNWTVFHQPIPLVSTEFGETLAGTYNVLSRADRAQPAAWRIPHRAPPWQPRVVPGYQHLYARLAHANEAQRDQELRAAALSFIGAHPSYLATVWKWNTLRLLDLAGLGRSRETAATIGLGPGSATLAAIAFWLLAPLALLGALGKTARGAPRALWAIPLLGYASIVFITTETPRFRAPLEPFVILLAAAAICDIARRVARRSDRRSSLGLQRAASARGGDEGQELGHDRP